MGIFPRPLSGALCDAEESVGRPTATVYPGSAPPPAWSAFGEHVQPVSSLVNGCLQDALERFVPTEFGIETGQVVRGGVRRHDSPFADALRVRSAL
jgi:hypothetical protein